MNIFSKHLSLSSPPLHLLFLSGSLLRWCSFKLPFESALLPWVPPATFRGRSRSRFQAGEWVFKSLSNRPKNKKISTIWYGLCTVETTNQMHQSPWGNWPYLSICQPSSLFSPRFLHTFPLLTLFSIFSPYTFPDQLCRRYGTLMFHTAPPPPLSRNTSPLSTPPKPSWTICLRELFLTREWIQTKECFIWNETFKWTRPSLVLSCCLCVAWMHLGL